MWQVYEGDSSELILQLVLWILSYFLLSMSNLKTLKALLNIPIKTIMLFSKVASYWCDMTRLITENASLFFFFQCIEQ